MNKTTARYIIIFLISLIIAFGTQISRLSFDYDFENLFATNDLDLAYYKEYKKIFGNDNDYMLVAFKPTHGVFDSAFLTKITDLESEIAEWDKVRYTLSPMSLKYLVRSPMGFLPIPYLRTGDSERLHLDSLRISENPEILKPFFGHDLGSIVMLVRHKAMDDASSKKFVAQLEKTIRAKNLGKYYLAGKAKAQDEFVVHIQEDFGKFLGMGALLIIIVLWILFRSIPILIVSVLVIVCVLVFTFGIMALVGVPIDVISALIPLLLIIVCISDLVHFLTRYKQEINAGTEVKDAVIKTWKDVGLATFLTSATTAIGFFTLLTASSAPIGNMGLYTGIGVLAAFGFTILILPTFATLFPEAIVPDHKPNGHLELPTHLLSKLLAHRWRIIILFGMLVVVALFGITKIQINAQLIEDLPDDTHIKESFMFFDKEIGGSKPWELSITVADTSRLGIYDWSVVQQLSKIERYLTHTYGIIGLSSPLTNVRMYEKAFSGKFDLPDSVTYSTWPNSWRVSRKKDVMEKFHDEHENIGRFTGFISDIGSAEAIVRDKALIAFLDENIDPNIISYRLTGTSFLIDRSHHIITYNLLIGLLIAVACIAAIAGLFFRNVWLVVVTLICNLLPIIFIAGTLGFLGINLSLSNGIIFAVSFGIAVDDTLHFVSKYQIERRKGHKHYESVENTLKSTGKAIINTTLILVAGFSLFVFSSFHTSFSIGLLVSLTLVFAVITDLVLLPVLLCLPYKVSKKKV